MINFFGSQGYVVLVVLQQTRAIKRFEVRPGATILSQDVVQSCKD